MKKKTFYLWLCDKDTKIQAFGIVEAFKITMNLVGKHFGGGTIMEGQWFYVHDNGEIVKENSLIISTVTDKEHWEFIETLKTLFNQESILVEIDNPKISFE